MCLDKNKIRQSFSAASETYDGMAGLQRRVGVDLLNRIKIDGNSKTILDLGCGTGFLTGELLAGFDCDIIVALDLALPMLHVTKQKIQNNMLSYLCADADKMPFSNATIDHLFSNLALQWCQNLSSVLLDFRRVIKTEGQLVFSTFGPTTLQELKTAWSEVDNFTHVNEFYSKGQIEQILLDAGFKRTSVESVSYQTNYSSVLELMKELKGIGAHNMTRGRNKKMTTRSQLQKMINNYEKRCSDGITASYEVIFVVAQA